MMQIRDKEIEAYSRVMLPPEEPEGGLSLRVMLCSFLIGLFMMPGILYLNLVIGASLGPAGRWVAVILFMEMMRRSRQHVKQQELFVLFAMAGMMMSSPFSGLLYNQFLVQSPFLKGIGIAEQIPHWVAPPASSESYVQRSFFHPDWFMPIALICFTMFIGHIDRFGLGLAIYYLTAKVEKLPFPMAPVGAAGTIALAENPEEKGAWKWRAFSVGSALGVVWGVLYMGVPILSEMVTGTRLELFPLPWWETSPLTEGWLPAVPTGIVMDFTLFMVGLVIPFWGVVGGVAGVLFTMMLNPLLVKMHVLTTWTPGMDTVQTMFSNTVDFYFSFGLGISFSVAIIGMVHVLWGLRRVQKDAPKQADEDTFAARFSEHRRGIALGVAVYAFASLCFSILIIMLVPEFPVAFLVVYAVFYVPILSYVSARLDGLVGFGIRIPFVREATLLLSGIRGVAVWFAPLGGVMDTEEGAASGFRQMELTGTRFRSIFTATFVALPVIIVFSLLASQLIWKMGEVPSAAFPYVEKMWQLQVQNQAILWSSTSGGDSLFQHAWNVKYILVGIGSGLGLASVLAWLSLPLNLFYGLITGLSASMPHSTLMTFSGALFARYVLWRKFGKQKWLQFAPVVLAGFTCGFGLAGILAFGVVLINKTVTSLPW